MGLKERIKNRRLELGMTLEDVAVKIGISRQTMQKYESGVVQSIPTDRIEQLAEALNTSPAFLMGWDTSQLPSDVPSKVLVDIESELRRLRAIRDDDSVDEIKLDAIIRLLRSASDLADG